MRTLVDVLRKVEQDFLADHHLDLTPWSEPRLVSMNVTTEADLCLAPEMFTAMAGGDTETYSRLEAERLAAKPSRSEMEDIAAHCATESRKRREAELLVPVTRVEVELVDNLKDNVRWNLSFAKVGRLSRTAAFRSLSKTASNKGFGFIMQSETYVNGRQELRQRLTLVFKSFGAADRELFGGEKGRTHMWYERP